MAFADEYDITTPDGSDNPTEGDDEIRKFKRAVQERLNVEHIFDLDGDEVSGANTGKHTDITGTSITTTGNGAIGGTLDVTGNFDPTTFETTNGGFLDDDTFADDAADKVASQQSIKAYIATAIAAAAGQYACITDQKTQNTAGDALTATTWNKRTLNTEQANAISGLSLASSVITLPAGTYQINAVAVVQRTGDNTVKSQLRLYDNTAAATLITGLSRHKDHGSGETPSINVHLAGQFTLSEESELELQNYVDTNCSGGIAVNAGVEVYAQVEIRKIGAS
jgi:hypothetical protein